MFFHLCGSLCWTIRASALTLWYHRLCCSDNNADYALNLNDEFNRSSTGQATVALFEHKKHMYGEVRKEFFHLLWTFAVCALSSAWCKHVEWPRTQTKAFNAFVCVRGHAPWPRVCVAVRFAWPSTCLAVCRYRQRGASHRRVLARVWLVSRYKKVA